MKGEGDRLKELESEIRALKIAVAEKTMALDAMEKPAEIANMHYGTDIKKKFRTETISGTKEMKGHSIRFLSIFFGYTHDGCYKSMEHGSASELNREVLISSVQEIRREHPRMGGKKMYYLPVDLTSSLHVGRDKFSKYLENRICLLSVKEAALKRPNSYHRFHVYKYESVYICPVSFISKKYRRFKSIISSVMNINRRNFL
ncbi:MAG: hypothetical protein LBK58_06140 [Prevotellaceae bacterium]|nr:hypothetical protein [Prevotellaceae bacterium]